jgi:hypothetical protein
MTGSRTAARLVARARRPPARSERSTSVGPRAPEHRPERPTPPSIGPLVTAASTTVARPPIPLDVETQPRLRVPEALAAPPAGPGSPLNLVGAQPAAVPPRQPEHRSGPPPVSDPDAAHAATKGPAESADTPRARTPHPELAPTQQNPIGRRLEAAAADRTTAADAFGSRPSTQRAVADLAPDPAPAAQGPSPTPAASPTPGPTAPVVIGTIEIISQPAPAPVARPDPLAPIADRRRHGRRRIGPRPLSC